MVFKKLLGSDASQFKAGSRIESITSESELKKRALDQETVYFDDGSRYEGEWKGDKQHGYGTANAMMAVCMKVSGKMGNPWPEFIIKWN